MTGEEISWTGYVDAVLRWRRFVILGIVSCWAVILVGGLLLPRQYDCEATLSFPPVVPPKVGEAPKPGIPIALFKRLNKALADDRILSRGLKSLMDPGEIRSVRLTLDSHVAPVTTSPLGDAQRMSREDTVIGVRISASGRSPEKSTQIVTALGGVCRETLIRALAEEQIGQWLARINDEARAALGEYSRKKVELASLDKQDAALARLVREFPGAGVSGGRQVVETRDGGYRYLPPVAQLVGVRAKVADYSHELRVAEHSLSLGALHVRFLETLTEHLDLETPVGVTAQDTLSVIREDLKHFSAQKPGEEADLTTLRLEVEALVSTLSSFSRTTSWTQLPTVTKKARVPAMAGAGALAALVVLAGALLGESWQRLHASP